MGRQASLTAVGLALGLLALSAAPLAMAEGTPDATGSPRPSNSNARVVASEGLAQWIECEGSGPLTLVVIAGLGAASSQWARLRPDLAALTRTCAYDRPGLGRSPSRPHPRTIVDASQHARELRDLLLAAGEPGPYLVLGHSYGGLVARAFARQFVGQVDGVVLMEGVDPRGQGASRYWHEAGQAIDMKRSRAQAAGLALGDRPLVVLSASNPGGDHLGGPRYGDSAASIASWRAQQRSSTRLSSNAMQVIAHSGHVVQQDNPQATVEAVRSVLDSIRLHAPLLCGSNWQSVRAKCVETSS